LYGVRVLNLTGINRNDSTLKWSPDANVIVAIPKIEGAAAALDDLAAARNTVERLERMIKPGRI